MHIEAKGDLKSLSNAVRDTFNLIKEIRLKNSLINSLEKPFLPKNSISSSKLESFFGMPGQSKNGMYKIVIGNKTNIDGIQIGKEMGVNSWAAFGGTDENAIVDGDFALYENELQSALKILRKGNINIVAIHNHMINENPRMIFVHYWGKGSLEYLAKIIKEVLEIKNNSK